MCHTHAAGARAHPEAQASSTTAYAEQAWTSSGETTRAAQPHARTRPTRKPQQASTCNSRNLVLRLLQLGREKGKFMEWQPIETIPQGVEGQ